MYQKSERCREYFVFLVLSFTQKRDIGQKYGILLSKLDII